MTHENIHPTGHMTLNVLDNNGNTVLSVAHDNRVLPAGQNLLLGLLKGDRTLDEFELILGADGFKPEADDPLKLETAVAVKLTGKPTRKLTNGTLVIAFNGNITREATVIGGGIVMPGKRGRTEVRELYNFAPTPQKIEMKQDQSVSVSFPLGDGITPHEPAP